MCNIKYLEQFIQSTISITCCMNHKLIVHRAIFFKFKDATQMLIIFL